MLLLLIRHALTARTGVKLSGWTPGIHLSKVGRAQAESLAERLDAVPLTAIYASPLERTAETAAPVARAKRLKVRTREDVGEVRYGDIEGRSLRALNKTKIWTQLRAWPSDVRFPGGESLRETQARAVTAIEDIRRKHPDGVVAVFSHGDWIRLAMAHHMGIHIDLYRRLSVDPVSVNVLQFYDMGVQVRRLNEIGTLGDLAPGAKR
ncbi:MAG TPA: MSMEG_4193 family putative phosphomutase [Actinomycetota bacterium]|nr:MSMEG_4193 family putative phosphomutase [Actinomycetota bacterium]